MERHCDLASKLVVSLAKLVISLSKLNEQLADMDRRIGTLERSANVASGEDRARHDHIETILREQTLELAQLSGAMRHHGVFASAETVSEVREIVRGLQHAIDAEEPN